jgi:2-hydroxychromene-2-carboxylate isomerase
VRSIALANRIALHPRALGTALQVTTAVAAALLAADDDRLRAMEREHGSIDEAKVGRRLRANAARLRSRGHYLGCTVRYEGEWYAGVDRLRHLRKRLRHEGLELPDPLVPRGSPPPVEPVRFDGAEPSIELFYSFRSPYSYLALDRSRALARRFQIPLRIRPVLPMVMRGLQVPFAKRLYIARDAKREAEHWGIPFGRVCDPLGRGIGRCMVAFTVAEQHDRSVELVASAARGIWSEALNVARDPDLKHVVERAAVPWEPVRERIEAGDESYQQLCEENRRALSMMGLWGVPVLRAGDFSVWGQDRIEQLEERLVAWREGRP